MSDAIEDRLSAPRPTEVPALGMSYQFQISERRSIVFQTHISNDVDQKTLDDILDTMQLAANRQQALLEIVDTERQLAALRQQLPLLEEDRDKAVVRMNAKIDADPRRRPREQERAQIANMQTSIDQHRMAIETKEGLLKALFAIRDHRGGEAANGAAT